MLARWALAYMSFEPYLSYSFYCMKQEMYYVVFWITIIYFIFTEDFSDITFKPILSPFWWHVNKHFYWKNLDNECRRDVMQSELAASCKERCYKRALHATSCLPARVKNACEVHSVKQEAAVIHSDPEYWLLMGAVVVGTLRPNSLT